MCVCGLLLLFNTHSQRRSAAKKRTPSEIENSSGLLFSSPLLPSTEQSVCVCDRLSVLSVSDSVCVCVRVLQNSDSMSHWQAGGQAGSVVCTTLLL